MQTKQLKSIAYNVNANHLTYHIICLKVHKIGGEEEAQNEDAGPGRMGNRDPIRPTIPGDGQLPQAKVNLLSPGRRGVFRSSAKQIKIPKLLRDQRQTIRTAVVLVQ